MSGLAAVADAARGSGAVLTVAHCCDRDVPFDVLRRAGFEAVAVDTELIGDAADEALGAWWDAGGVVVLGAVPSLDDPRLTAEDLARRVMRLWSRIGFGIADVGERTWLSPACGLAGASPTWAREVGALMRARRGCSSPPSSARRPHRLRCVRDETATEVQRNPVSGDAVAAQREARAAAPRVGGHR